MRIQLSKWGNSLGLRLPRVLAREIGAREGQVVEVSVESGRLIVQPATRAPRLEELLAGMTPEAMREAFEWGDERGREVLDE